MNIAHLSVLDRNAMRRPPGPIDPLQRIDAIDVLRGVALFGVLANNLVSEFRVSAFAYLLPDGPAAPLDRMVEFLLLAIDTKALALFLTAVRRRYRHPVRAACGQRAPHRNCWCAG